MCVSISRAQYLSIEDTSIGLGNPLESNDNVLAGKGEGRDGCISYDAETRTLTLKGASLKSREQFPRLTISDFTDTLTIRLVGENSLYSPNTNTFKIFNSKVRLTGSGSLSVSNGNDSKLIAFVVNKPGSSLLIDSTTLIVNGSFQSPATDATLVVRHSTVKASRTLFKEITLDDCYISEPAGAFIGVGKDEIGSFHAIADKEGNIAQNYVILPGSITTYPIIVDGVTISAENKENVLAGQGAGRDGCVSYNEETKTLTLKSAHLISSSGGKVFYVNEFGGDPLTVNLEGDNYMESKSSNTFVMENSMVCIQGSGTLKVISNSSIGILPLGEGADLTISGTTLSVKGEAAIYNPDFGASLTIDNSTVNAEGSILAKTITLKECFIKSPVGGSVGNGNPIDGKEFMALWDASGKPAMSSVILPNSELSINSVEESKVRIRLNQITKELKLSGLNSREKVSLIDMMGIKLAELMADEKGLAEQSLEDLPIGYYLIVTSKGTHKIYISK